MPVPVSLIRKLAGRFTNQMLISLSATYLQADIPLQSQILCFPFLVFLNSALYVVVKHIIMPCYV